MAFTFQCWHPCYSMFVRCFLTFFVSFFTGAETAFTSDDGWWACMGWRKEADGCIWLTVSYGFIQNVKGTLYHGCMTCDTWHSYFWTRWVGATRLDKHWPKSRSIHQKSSVVPLAAKIMRSRLSLPRRSFRRQACLGVSSVTRLPHTSAFLP